MSKNSLAHLRKSSIYMMFCYDSDIELRKDNTTYQHIASFPVCPDNLEAEHDRISEKIRAKKEKERTEHHTDIINLVNSNARLIEQRMVATT